MKKRLFSSLVTALAWTGISLGQDARPTISFQPASPEQAVLPALSAPVPVEQPAPAPLSSPMAPSASLPSSAAASGAGCFPSRCINPCGDRFYIGADYLLWWVKSGPMPPDLVTTGPFTGGLDGAIGQPGTTSLTGPSLHYGAFSGARVTAGYWFDSALGIEASGFLLEQRTSTFSASSPNGSQVIAMPVTSAFNGENIRFTIAAPNLRSGSIDIASSTQLFGAELNGLVNLYRDNNFKITGLYGFRWVELDESMVMTGNSKALTNGLGPDNIIFNGQELVNSSNMVVDSFGTRNSFYGAQFGARAEWTNGKWFTVLSVKVGLGDSHEVITNSGSTSAIIGPGNGGLTGLTPNPYPYGRFVGPSNAGTFSRDSFAVIPEAELKIGYQFTRYLKGYVGYNFMYWSNVVRPGDQISQTVDFRGTSTGDTPPRNFINGFTGTTAPIVPFHTTDFWAQGINFGLIFTY